MRSLLSLVALVLALSAPARAAVSATVVGVADQCGDIFCLTLTATSDAGAGDPSYIEITVPVPIALFTVDIDAPCRVIPSQSTTRVFIGCELVAWQGHAASTIIRLTPVVHNGGIWITPSAYVSDPTDPVDLMVAPILVPVPIFVYLPIIHR